MGEAKLASWILLALAIVGCDQQRTAGAVGTGNTGRIQGHLVGSDTGRDLSAFQVRLLRTLGSTVGFADSARPDTAGTFRFPSEEPGTYIVEAWKDGAMWGRSGAFQVDGDVSGIVVVLVSNLRQISMDLSRIGTPDSVYIDYPGNPAVLVDGKWLGQASRDTGFVVHTLLPGPPSHWEAWIYLVRDGKAVLINQEDSRSVSSIRSVDTGAFLLGPHTVALWAFDTLAGGVVRDKSPRGNDLVLPQGAVLASSPSGKAWLMEGTDPAGLPGNRVPSELNWNTKGTMTWEMRVYFDSLSHEGMFLMAYENFVIHLAPDGKLAVGGSWLSTTGAAAGHYAITSEAHSVPTGRWVDLAVSLDRDRVQVYAWIDQKPVPLYVRNAWDDNLVFDAKSPEPFCVGSRCSEQIPSHFRIDEMRISDTLVYGRGYDVKPDWSTNLDLSTGMAGMQIRSGSGWRGDSLVSDEAFVGLDTSRQEVGALALRFAIPQKLQSKTVISAFLYLWDTMSVADRSMDFSFCRLLEDWSVPGVASQWVGPDGRYAPGLWDSDCRIGLLQQDSKGGIVPDVTEMVQQWVNDPSSNHGILVRAMDEAGVPGRTLITSTSDGYGEEYRPRIEIKYR